MVSTFSEYQKSKMSHLVQVQISKIVLTNCISNKILLLLLHLFNGLFSGTTWVSWYRKDKTSLDLNEARDDGVLG